MRLRTFGTSRPPAARWALLIVLGTGCRDKEGETTEDLATANTAPVAEAGSNTTQTADAPISVDGSASTDADGDALTYHWSFSSVPEGSTLAKDDSAFSDNHGATPSATFRADATGSYVVALTVEDASGATSPADFVVINVEAGGLPVADAGADLSGLQGETFSLDGTRSYDPYGRTLTYQWSFASVPGDSNLSSLTGETSSAASFVADAAGKWIISLVVGNGLSDSQPDTVLVTTSVTNPEPPVAAAGEDLTVSDCTWVDLDGSNSYDPNNQDLTYQWAIQSTPADSSGAAFSDEATAITQFWPDVYGEYTVSLAVSDGTDWSTPDLLTLTAAERLYNTPPTVDPGRMQSVDGGEQECVESGYAYDCEECAAATIKLGDGASTVDADGDPLTYLWEVLSGEATIADPTSAVTEAELSGAAPVEPGLCEATEFEFQVTVTDCTGASTTSTIIHEVNCCGAKK